MAENINANCMICGKGYHMCLSCKDMVRLKPWQLHTDTSEHYKIYQILHGHTTGVYSDKEAKEKLQLVDLSDVDTFRPEVKAAIHKIMDYVEQSILEENTVDEEKPKKAVRKKKSANVVETEKDTVPTLND